MNTRRRVLTGLGSALVLAGLAGCGGSDDGTTRVAYTVTLTNLTSAQPLAPMGAILHGEGYSGWSVGGSASPGLETLAEAGDAGAWLAEAATAGAPTTASGAGVVPPGGSSDVTLEADESPGLLLTVAAMLVNTNDAFAGVASLDVTGLSVGDTLVRDLAPYDAGTEANTESAATVPGPAAGGEGFNPARDDRDFVSIHPGVISAADGLAGSALGEEHRFQSPVARLRVVRTR